MGTIIPDINKDRLTKGLQYPLHYSDLEAALAEPPVDPLYVDAWFSTRYAYAKDERERCGEEGRLPLVALEYGRERHWVPPWAPWAGADDPTIVSVHIYAVPHAAVVDSHLTRPRLRAILTGEIDRIGRRTLFANRWRVRLTLLLDELVVEGVTETWTGLRAEPERRFWVRLVDMASDSGTG